MKLDVNVLRYLAKEDFRVLTSVEMGQKNHELVPAVLIDSISGLKHGGAFRCLKTLLRHKLVHHEATKYDGYRLTTLGYDFLAIRTLVARGHIISVGRQIGVGKESDIFEVCSDEGEILALKLHRLGRTSFRAVKSKRDYLGKRSSFSWLYLSRLAALKEYAFMKALGDHGFPVPRAVDHNRHAVLMSMVDAAPLVQLRELSDPRGAYTICMSLLYRLAAKGLVHCDFNEFNLLVGRTDEAITMIDFPQMVSVGHANAQELFDRDVDCIVRFFTKKLGYHPDEDEDFEGELRPNFEDAVAEAAAAAGAALDIELAASGFKRQHQQVLEAAFAAEASSEEGDSDEDEDESGSGASGSGSGEEEDEEGEEEESGSGEGEEGEAAAGEAGPSGDADAPLSLAALRLAEGSENGGDGASSLGSSFGPASGSEGEEEGEGGGAGGGQRRRGGKKGGGKKGAADGGGDEAARAVQQRLVQQRRKAERMAGMAKASRNSSKHKDKHAKKAAAAIAEW